MESTLHLFIIILCVCVKEVHFIFGQRIKFYSYIISRLGRIKLQVTDKERSKIIVSPFCRLRAIIDQL